MLKTFKYRKGTEEQERTVLVLHTGSNWIAGIDLAYLSESEKEAATALLKDVEEGPPDPEAKPIEGYNKDWNKAWRRFSNMKITG